MEWKEKNVLVTGGAGFVGSWLSKALLENGANVIVLTKKGALNPILEYMGVYPKLKACIEGDITDFEETKKIFSQYETDTCFHLAAQAIVGIANESPITTFETNIKGTWNILEIARVLDLDRIIVASTDKVYGEPIKLPITEDHPLLASYPYDASKACADILSRMYFKTYNIPVAVTRCFPAGTLVTTNYMSERPIEELKAGDIVITHNNRSQPVLRTFKREYKGRLIRVRATGLTDIFCTPNHKFYAIKRKDLLCIKKTSNGRVCRVDDEQSRKCRYYGKMNNAECYRAMRPEWVEASNLELGDFVAYSIADVCTKDIKFIDILNYVEFDGKMTGNILREVKARYSIPRYIPVDKDFMTLVGYFLAEGSYIKEKGKYTGLSFCFGIKEKQYCNEVVNILKRIFSLDPFVTRNKKGNTLQIRVTNKIIAMLFLALCGEYSCNKTIHRNIISLPVNKLKYLLEAFERGDASVTEKRNSKLISLNVVSENLSNQLWNIANRCRLMPCRYRVKSKNKKRQNRVYYVYGKSRHTRLLKDNIVFAPVKEINWTPVVKYPVYNLQVFGDESFFANGYLVHNCCNIYGGGDLNFSRIIPDSIRSVILNKNPIIRSDGTPVRDFIYIADVVSGYLTLAENLERNEVKGEAFNFGSNSPISILDLVNKIIKISGKKLKPEIVGKGKPKAEIDRQYLSSEKAEKLLNWKPKVSLEEGLRKTMKWYEEYFKSASLPRFHEKL